MVAHLTQKAAFLERLAALRSGDVVLDIGSNDSTLLRSYSRTHLRKIGIDHRSQISGILPRRRTLGAGIFLVDAYRRVSSTQAKVVTSVAMFYDLENPVSFAQQVASVLASDGLWHFEQSYMPSMLRMNSYDTICHEHLEYYSLGVVIKILAAASLEPVDVVMNAVNGGSFAVTATHKANKSIPRNWTVVDWLLHQEDRMGLNTPRPYRDFEERVFRHRHDLTRLIRTLVADKKTILGMALRPKATSCFNFAHWDRKRFLLLLR